MLGLKRLEADFTYAATPNTFTAAVDGTSGEGLLQIGFQVEEDEMFVHLYCRMLVDIDADDTCNFTFYVDNSDVETVGTAGLVQVPLLAASDPSTVVIEKTLRLDRGFHTVAMRMLTAGAGVPTLAGATIPCELEVRRSSHPATLGHGVDSKAQLIQ